jgi:hypothetical protein
MAQQGTHGVHLRMAGRPIASASVHLFKDSTASAKGQTSATVILWDQRRKEARTCQSLNKFSGVRFCSIHLSPIITLILRAQAGHSRSNFGVGLINRHGMYPQKSF